MEHNTIAEMKEILNAIEQGKEVQWYDDNCDVWIDSLNGGYPNFHNCRYRIKPEAQQKKLRPFTDTNELIAYNDGLRILWLKDKTTGDYDLVTTYANKYIKCMDYRYTMEELLENYTFADGTPCGVEENV